PRQRVQTLQCGQGAVRAARFNVDGNYCLTCGSDKTLKLWNPHKGTALRTYQGHGYEVLDAAGSCDNSQICSGGADKAVALWDVTTGQVVRKYRGHAGVRRGRGRCEALGPRDPDGVRDEPPRHRGTPRTGDPLNLPPPHSSVDGRVRRYDLRTGQLCSDYIGSPITSVCFSKDGQCVLAASLDSTLRLLDKDTGELLGEYTGHRSTTYRLDCVLNEQDTHVGCASEDGHVYFWDLVEGSLALSLPVGQGVVQSLAFHPRLSCLLAATQGQVTLWREDTFQPEGDPS
ncbi:WDR83 protein, partial [Picathartes gymnocephalus]|nr:WDR83 protein [Picathartes gymnocephalus]